VTAVTYSALDVEALRRTTPAIVQTNRAHFNHAGASLVDENTFQVMQAHLQAEIELGAMEAAARAQPSVERVRVSAATMIGAQPNEIAFLPSGSLAFGLAFAALPPLRQGERILVGRHEFS
jgi:cysteine desulfurase / selenocysteine lyase